MRSPQSTGIPRRHHRVKPTPTKSPATNRFRGKSARAIFAPEFGQCDDTLEAYPLTSTDVSLLDNEVIETLGSRDYQLNDEMIRGETFQASDSQAPSISIQGDTFESDLFEMSVLLPTVLKTLDKCGTKDSLLDFFRLVNSKRFPLDTILFLLWIEVQDLNVNLDT